MIRYSVLFLSFMLYMYFAIMFDLINITEQEENRDFAKKFVNKPPNLETNNSYTQQTFPVDLTYEEEKVFFSCDKYESRCLHYSLFNCENIKRIKLLEKIGHGVTKQAFLGSYEGKKVVVKMVTRHQREARECLDGLLNRKESDPLKRSRCFVFPTMKLMKEILLLHQLRHDGFLKLLGYCVRSEESDSTDLSEHGVIAVYERGTNLSPEKLKSLSTEDKVRQALHLVSFFQYLANSPLGSLRIRDFKIDHFLMVNSTIKMIDLDDIDNIEPSCNAYSAESDAQKVPCMYGLRCEMGLCNGHNAKRNMEKANELFFAHLLTPAVYPTECFKMLQNIHHSLSELSVNYSNLRSALRKLLESVIYPH